MGTAKGERGERQFVHRPPNIALRLINHSIHNRSITDQWGKLCRNGVAIVVDIGKTLSKVTLWSRDGRLLDRKCGRTPAVSQGVIAPLDVQASSVAGADSCRICTASPIRGDRSGRSRRRRRRSQDDRLPSAPLDYEQPLDRGCARIPRWPRPLRQHRFTGPAGWPQPRHAIDWLEPHRTWPAEVTIVPWAQYWAWFLSGVRERSHQPWLPYRPVGTCCEPVFALGAAPRLGGAVRRRARRGRRSAR